MTGTSVFTFWACPSAGCKADQAEPGHLSRLMGCRTPRWMSAASSSMASGGNAVRGCPGLRPVVSFPRDTGPSAGLPSGRDSAGGVPPEVLRVTRGGSVPAVIDEGEPLWGPSRAGCWIRPKTSFATRYSDDGSGLHPSKADCTASTDHARASSWSSNCGYSRTSLPDTCQLLRL
jgi:hypothetical protein